MFFCPFILGCIIVYIGEEVCKLLWGLPRERGSAPVSILWIIVCAIEMVLCAFLCPAVFTGEIPARVLRDNLMIFMVVSALILYRKGEKIKKNANSIKTKGQKDKTIDKKVRTSSGVMAEIEQAMNCMDAFTDSAWNKRFILILTMFLEEGKGNNRFQTSVEEQKRNAVNELIGLAEELQAWGKRFEDAISQMCRCKDFSDDEYGALERIIGGIVEFREELVMLSESVIRVKKGMQKVEADDDLEEFAREVMLNDMEEALDQLDEVIEETVALLSDLRLLCIKRLKDLAIQKKYSKQEERL